MNKSVSQDLHDYYKIDADKNKSIIYLSVKRLIDIIGSLTAIILLSPVFIIIAIAIKVEDPKGTIFFSQERNGKYPKLFKMHKFRSMVHNAEELLETLKADNEMSGPVFKM